MCSHILYVFEIADGGELLDVVIALEVESLDELKGCAHLVLSAWLPTGEKMPRERRGVQVMKPSLAVFIFGANF